MMRKIAGDIVRYCKKDSNGVDVLIHACAADNSVGVGLNAAIYRGFPCTMVAAISGPDKWPMASVVRSVDTDCGLVIYNLITHPRTGRARDNLFNYTALSLALDTVAGIEPPGRVIAFPSIGTGAVGGRWRAVKKLIRASLATHDLRHIVPSLSIKDSK